MPLSDDRAGSSSAELSAPRFDLITCVDGTVLKAAALPEVLITLKNGGTAGWRFSPRALGPTGPVSLAALDWRDAEQLDLTVLSQITAQLAGAETQAALCLIPVSFHTLSSQKGRTEIASRVGELIIQEKCRVVLELRDLKGVPLERLTAVVNQIRPICFSIVAEVGVDKAELGVIAGSGVTGFVLRTMGDWTLDAKASAAVSAFCETARRIIPIRLGRVPDRSRLPLLEKAGFTHASVPIRSA